MNRRTCLSLLGTGALVGTAGCLSNGTDSTPAGPPSTAGSPTASSSERPSATASPPDVETPAPGECVARPPPDPSTYDGLPDPRPYPERPTELEKTPVREYLEAYETAYRFNRRLADIASTGECLSYLEMTVTESTVTSVENGVAGEVVTRGSFTGTTCPGTTGTDTPTPLPHADLAPEAAEYFVTERFLLRDGTVLECWN